MELLRARWPRQEAERAARFLYDASGDALAESHQAGAAVASVGDLAPDLQLAPRARRRVEGADERDERAKKRR